MKTALVYDWFADGAGGGERTFDAIFSMYPSPIYALLRSVKSIEGASFEKAEFHTSFIEKLPWGVKKYRSYLPLFPLAIEQFDLSGYDLVLSCSHCVAKGVLTHADQLHLCYCYTPVRYAWDLQGQYLDDSGMKGWKLRLAQLVLHYLRLWDVQSVNRVDAFGAISNYVARRIKKTYGREARVIYPPVDVEMFQMEERKDDYYVAASRFVSYKKIDLIVEAFAGMPEKKLVVIGDGPDMKKIKAKAGKNVELLGYQPDGVLRQYLQKARAFIFAAIEDFGILPVEAQACGTPVIALGKGASLETVVDGVSGMFFDEQTVGSIRDAVERFEAREGEFSPQKIRVVAERFGRERFEREFRHWVESEVEMRGFGGRGGRRETSKMPSREETEWLHPNRK